MDLSGIIWDIDINDIKKPLLASPQLNHIDQFETVENEINVQFLAGYSLKNNILQFKMNVSLNPRRSHSGTNFIN